MHRIKINIPTLLTLIRATIAPIIISLLIIWFVPQHNNFFNYMLSFLFVLGALTDFFDGYLARTFNQQTRLGALLDPIADKLYLCSVFIALVAVGLLFPLWAIIFIGREIYMSSLRYIAATYHITIKVSDAGKQKTAAQMTLVALLLATAHQSPVSGMLAMLITLVLSCSLWLTLVSAYRYTLQCRDIFEDPPCLF